MNVEFTSVVYIEFVGQFAKSIVMTSQVIIFIESITLSVLDKQSFEFSQLGFNSPEYSNNNN